MFHLADCREFGFNLEFKIRTKSCREINFVSDPSSVICITDEAKIGILLCLGNRSSRYDIQLRIFLFVMVNI
jgi:hypothetical protein